MPDLTGTLTIDDLLAVEHQSAAEYGLDRIQEVLEADVEAHNQILEELIAGLCEITTDRQRIYGSSQRGSMTEVDEFGLVRTQGTKPSSSVGFPLRKFQYAIGWTSTWFKTHTPADMARAVQSAQKAHLQMVITQIKYAIFRAANYTFNDFLVDKVDLSVARFLNADGQIIPDGPNGEQFNGASHTHYTATDGLAVADLLVQINDVVEHGNGGMVKMAINRANETAVKALTGFQAYTDPRIALGTHANQPETRLDITRIDNRAIGILGAAEVWVKPWNPASYTFVYDEEAEEKPLAYRQRDVDSLQGLQIAAELDTHPLHAQYMEAEFGVGVWNRTNGAVHYFGGSSYTNPF